MGFLQSLFLLKTLQNLRIILSNKLKSHKLNIFFFTYTPLQLLIFIHKQGNCEEKTDC